MTLFFFYISHQKNGTSRNEQILSREAFKILWRTTPKGYKKVLFGKECDPNEFYFLMLSKTNNTFSVFETKNFKCLQRRKFDMWTRGG